VRALLVCSHDLLLTLGGPESPDGLPRALARCGVEEERALGGYRARSTQTQCRT
jgi:hypothetical protein